MTDREKVIAKLTCMTGGRIGTTCNTCPLFGNKETKIGRKSSLLERVCTYGDDEALRDALAVLRAQEPRVLTREELRGFYEDGIPVWIEDFESLGGWALLYESKLFGGGSTIYAHDTYGCNYQEENYLDTWRAWTAQPTDEQRMAVKWDD